MQLGIKYQPEGMCPHCHYTGVLFNGGFGSNDRRRALCPHADGRWVRTDGQAASVAVRIVRAPALIAVERRKRVGQGAPELPAIRRAVLKVPPRTMQSAIDAPAMHDPCVTSISSIVYICPLKIQMDTILAFEPYVIKMTLPGAHGQCVPIRWSNAQTVRAIHHNRVSLSRYAGNTTCLPWPFGGGAYYFEWTRCSQDLQRHSRWDG